MEDESREILKDRVFARKIDEIIEANKLFYNATRILPASGQDERQKKFNGIVSSLANLNNMVDELKKLI